MSLNLHLLRLFATVVRTGSFSRSADALHISQPAISKGVRDFESQVGCRLLDRTPKGVRPTLEGKALVRHAEALSAAERAAEDELLSLRNLDSGSLRIGASTTIATYMISDHLGTSDQVTLGRLKVVPMRDLQIERMLWQLKVPGRIEFPAATAFERMIWQDKRAAEMA